MLSRAFLTLGTVSTLGLIYAWRRRREQREAQRSNIWARPGMQVIFRAELMPGRDAAARTFRVLELLNSNRVRLEGFSGEHSRDEFEPLRFT